MSRQRKSIWWRTLGVAIVLCLAIAAGGALLAACGGDEGDGGDGGESGGGEPIKVGVVTSTSGLIAADGQALLGAVKAWAEQVNAGGGLLDRQVELVVQDSASDPKTANEKAKAVLGDDVDVVIGPILSAERNAVQPTVTGAGKIVLYSTFYEGGAYDDLMFITGEVPEQQTQEFVPYLVENYGPKFYFIGSDYVYPRGTNAKATEYLEAAGGEVVGEEYVALGTTDFSSSLTRIAKAKPDVLFCNVVGTDGIALSKQFYDYGLSEDVTFASTVHMESYITAIGPEASEGTVVCFGYFENLDTPENQAFLESYRAVEPNVPATTITARAYVVMQMWGEAVETAGSTDAEAVAEAFAGLAMTGTPIGDVTMRATDHHTEAHTYVAVVKNGEFEVVEDLGMTPPGEDQRNEGGDTGVEGE